MASFRFEIQRRQSRNKKYDIYMIINVAGKRSKKKTGIQVLHIDDFNPKCRGNNWIRAGVTDSKALNERLRVMLVDANEKFNDLESGGEVTATGVKNALNVEKVSPSFLEFARERAQMIYDNGGWRNWRKYCGLINKLDVFRKKLRMKDITIEDITVDFLIKLDNFLHKWENEREPGKLLHPNTIEVQFNILKTLVHRAIEVGIMNASKDPFLVFKYKGVKTVKDKLTENEIERIISLELEQGSLIWHCKNYFLFSFYCAGIRASDLIQLRWRNIIERRRLHYQMGKNHKDRDLVLVPKALEILKLYHKENTYPDDYIFPLLNNDAPYAKYITQADKDKMLPDIRSELYKAVSTKNALINKYLKKIANLAGITTNLSMHISRHSFAHIAQEAGAGSSAIKEILGHSNLATTERYMGSFDTSKTDATLINLFGEESKGESGPDYHEMSKKELAIKLLSELDAMDFVDVINSIKK